MLVINNTKLIGTFNLHVARLTAEGVTASGLVHQGTFTVTVVANGARDAGEAAKPGHCERRVDLQGGPTVISAGPAIGSEWQPQVEPR